MIDKLKNIKILVHTAIFPWDTYTDKEVIDMDWLSGNSGNQLFRWGVLNLFENISHENFITTWDFSHNLELQKIKYDYFVLPMSNTLREGSDDELKYLTDIMNRIDAKILVAGLGGMFSREGFHKFSNEHLIKEFIETAIEKTTVIGLRDNYSYQYLTDYLDYPKEKFRIIGCPSVTYKGYFLEKQNYYKIRTDRYNTIDQDFKIAVNYIAGEYDYHWASFIDKVLFENQRTDVFLQDIDEARLIEYGYSLEDERRHDLLVGDAQHFAFKEGRARFIPNPNKWIDELKAYKFSLGTRIHGAIAAALAGLPVMVIATDSNTAGLAQYHRLPYIWDYELTEKTSVEELYYRACFEMQSYYDFFDESYDNYVNFIAQNNIDLSILNESLIPKRVFKYDNSVVANHIGSWDVYLDELSQYFEIRAENGIEFRKNSKKVGKANKDFWAWQNFRTKVLLQLNHKYRIIVLWEGKDKEFMINAQDGSEVLKISDELADNIQKLIFELEIKNDDIDHIGFSENFKRGKIHHIGIEEIENDKSK